MSPCKPPLILLACALGIGLAACGGSSNSGGSGSAASSAPGKGPTLNAGIDATIAANWTAFFNAKSPVPKRISLLQNGQEFASIIQSQAGKGLASEATASVTGVEQLTPTTAKVVYDILLDGEPALKAQSGMAVLQDGTWKVGVTSFCGLLVTEAGSAKGLPAACQTAG